MKNLTARKDGQLLNSKNKTMYRQQLATKTTLKVNQCYVGETIERKLQRVVQNKEPITDGAPLTYTDRKDGVQPQYDIRTDRFEIAIDAMDKVTKSHVAKREMAIGERTYDTMSDTQKAEFNTKFPNNKFAKQQQSQQNQQS